MKHFKRITTSVKDNEKQNAVIMGRNTWESIPVKFKPLSNRLNVILSESMTEAPEGTLLSKSFDGAMTTLSHRNDIEDIHVIGGSRVYDVCMKSPSLHRIYLTQVNADIKCDTFLPEFDTKVFTKIDCPEISSELQTENGLSYTYEVYERAENETEETTMKFNVLAAMSENRGIGIENNLPWPKIKSDYEYYRRQFSYIENPDQVNIAIRGRQTWYCIDDNEKVQANTINIVISTNKHDIPEHVQHIASSFDGAVQLSQKLSKELNVYKIWVMGGQKVFEDSVNHADCDKLYLTRVRGTYTSDRFFPKFEEQFKEISEDGIDQAIQEENSIQFSYHVYKKL